MVNTVHRMKSWSYGVDLEGGIWKALTIRTAASQRDKDDALLSQTQLCEFSPASVGKCLCVTVVRETGVCYPRCASFMCFDSLSDRFARLL